MQSRPRDSMTMCLWWPEETSTQHERLWNRRTLDFMETNSCYSSTRRPGDPIAGSHGLLSLWKISLGVGSMSLLRTNISPPSSRVSRATAQVTIILFQGNRLLSSRGGELQTVNLISGTSTTLDSTSTISQSFLSRAGCPRAKGATTEKPTR